MIDLRQLKTEEREAEERAEAQVLATCCLLRVNVAYNLLLVCNLQAEAERLAAEQIARAAELARIAAEVAADAERLAKEKEAQQVRTCYLLLATVILLLAACCVLLATYQGSTWPLTCCAVQQAELATRLAALRRGKKDREKVVKIRAAEQARKAEEERLESECTRNPVITT